MPAGNNSDKLDWPKVGQGDAVSAKCGNCAFFESILGYCLEYYKKPARPDEYCPDWKQKRIDPNGEDYGRTTPGENGMISLLPIIIVIKSIQTLSIIIVHNFYPN
jgi:hypothetical protein